MICYYGMICCGDLVSIITIMMIVGIWLGTVFYFLLLLFLAVFLPVFLTTVFIFIF